MFMTLSCCNNDIFEAEGKQIPCSKMYPALSCSNETKSKFLNNGCKCIGFQTCLASILCFSNICNSILTVTLLCRGSINRAVNQRLETVVAISSWKVIAEIHCNSC